MIWLLLVLALGVNLLLWGSVGAVRYAAQRGRRLFSAYVPPSRIKPHQVAVLIAAHNEELGVRATVDAAHTQVPRGNVFVVSDGSKDATVATATHAGASVYDLNPNRGKAGALAAAIRHFTLAERFEVVMLLDADTVLSADYMKSSLNMFDDPDVVAIAGRAATVWDKTERLGFVGTLLRAYRERLYVLFQVLLKYGQASRLTNAVTIVPGFASMYRTRILSSIDIDAPGLAIEDFNMTFEVHARRLGRIAFHPRRAIAYTQDPHNLRDYSKQVERWSLGFWQTLRRHGLHLGRFWYLLAAFVAEVLTSSVVFVMLGPALLLSAAGQLWLSLVGPGGDMGMLAENVSGVLPPHVALLGVVLPDYLFTVIVAIAQRRASYLFYGLFFVPLRCVDAWLCLRALWRSRRQSVGVWKSPERRAVGKVTITVAQQHGTVPRQLAPAQTSPALTSAGHGAVTWPGVPALAPAVLHGGQERSLASLGVGSYSYPRPAEG